MIIDKYDLNKILCEIGNEDTIYSLPEKMFNEHDFNNMPKTNNKTLKELQLAVSDFFEDVGVQSLISYIDPATYKNQFHNWLSGKRYIEVHKLKLALPEHLFTFLLNSIIYEALNMLRMHKREQINKYYGVDNRCE